MEVKNKQARTVTNPYICATVSKESGRLLRQYLQFCKRTKSELDRIIEMEGTNENIGFKVLSAWLVIGDQQNEVVCATKVGLAQNVPPISTRSVLSK